MCHGHLYYQPPPLDFRCLSCIVMMCFVTMFMASLYDKCSLWSFMIFMVLYESTTTINLWLCVPWCAIFIKLQQMKLHAMVSSMIMVNKFTCLIILIGVVNHGHTVDHSIIVYSLSWSNSWTNCLPWKNSWPWINSWPWQK